MILKPLQKIQVIESTKICKVGSLGYLVAQDPVGNYNIWSMYIVFTRFGKGGKPRIEPMSISTPMINYTNMPANDRSIIDIVKFYDGLEPRPYTDRVGNFYYGSRATTLAPIPMESKNLLELPDNEFTAYVVALSLFIYKLIHRISAADLQRRPKLGFINFAETGFDLATVGPEWIGYYITHGIERDNNLKRGRFGFNENQSFNTSYNQQIDNKAKKEALLSRLHMALAMARKAFKTHNLITYDSFAKVSAKITDVVEYYKRVRSDLHDIKASEMVRAKEMGYSYLLGPKKNVAVKRKVKMRRLLR